MKSTQRREDFIIHSIFFALNLLAAQKRVVFVFEWIAIAIAKAAEQGARRIVWIVDVDATGLAIGDHVEPFA